MYTILNYKTLEVIPFANAEAVAEHLGISAQLLRAKIRRSKIHSVRIGDILIEKKELIKSKKIDEFAKKRRKSVSL